MKTHNFGWAAAVPGSVTFLKAPLWVRGEVGQLQRVLGVPDGGGSLFSGVASPWRSAGPALVVIVVPNSSPCLPGVLPSRSERLEVERLHLARSFGGDVKSCLTDRCYALSCLVGRCYAQQIFQRLQAVSAGGTWQHGADVYQWRPRRAELFARREEVPLGAVVASTTAGPSKIDASV